MRRAHVELLGLLTVLLFTPALHAQRVSLEELADSDAIARKALGEISAPAFHETLSLLAREQGITPRSDAVVSATELAGEVLITELDDSLDDPRDSEKRLFLFFSPAKDEAFFLQIRLGADATPEMRLWAEGPSEIVIAGDDVRLLPAPSGATFRLSGRRGRDKLSVSDTIDCIARALGIHLNRSSLTSLLSSAVCSATSTITLVLTACNCLSVFGIGANTIFATIGCINGITKLVSCGIASCASASCDLTAISFDSPVSSSWTQSCASTHRSGRYAKFYTFSLSSTTTVVIDLSSSIDPYLYLLQGSGTVGVVLESDNNSGPGSDSRIITTLAPGSYTIEATTSSRGRSGEFRLSLVGQ